MRDYRVLIVEDDLIDRQYYCRLLAQLGTDACLIHHAEDAAAGLAALRKETFDCVLLDLNLPSMNGFEFLTSAAVNGEVPCAVVLITGQGSEAIAVEAMKRGVQDYLVKDQVNANSLWRALTQAVSQMELRQRLARSLHDLTAVNLALEQEATIRRAAEVALRASKEAAEQANQAKTRFVAMVTHELRTPLNGFLGFAQILRNEGGLSSRQDHQVDAMMQAGRHLLAMVEGVLDFANVETGRMQLRRELVPMRELVDACMLFVTPMAAERDLTLQVTAADDAPLHFVTDPARLRQVLLNLLGNAVKYTDTGTIQLRIGAGTTPGTLRIEVADTGCGVADANRERIFKEFERVDPTGAVQGTGLGLAIATRIVALMGGTINHDAGPNGGSVFWFELPAVKADAAILCSDDDALAAQPDAKVGDSTSRCSGWRMLLVDDVAINLEVIGSFLRTAGNTAVLAESGAEAVRLAAEEDFDLILMDLRMPEIDGLEAARRIRLLPGSHGQVPILALTAYPSLNQVAQCLDVGMNGHVAKPIDYETLMQAVGDTIARVPSYGS